MFSVIVTTDNRFELLTNFFERLLKGTDFTKGEIVIVLNGCSDLKAISYLEKLSLKNNFIKLIKYENRLGYSKANNIAVENSSYDNLVFLNTDVLPENNAIEILVDYMESDESIGVAQGRLVYPQDNTIQSTGHIFEDYYNAHLYKGKVYNDPLVMEPDERQALTSAFYVMKKETFIKFGGFDEVYYNAYEGMELSLKIKNGGLKCMYYPKALAYHITGGSRKDIHYDNNYADKIFWSRWHNTICNDLSYYIGKQLTTTMKSKTYLHINCSSLPFWERLLSELNFNISKNLSINNTFSETIELYTQLPYEILKLKEPILFTCNDIISIKENFNWNKIRNNPDDLVIDSHGNVEIFSKIVGEK